jgi:thiol-disulfide isomerase/thioredoxin
LKDKNLPVESTYLASGNRETEMDTDNQVANNQVANNQEADNQEAEEHTKSINSKSKKTKTKTKTKTNKSLVKSDDEGPSDKQHSAEKPMGEESSVSDPEHTLVVGIVHAHWCPHCTVIMGPPEEQPFPKKPSIWKSAMKTINKKKPSNVETVFIDIESDKIDTVKTMVNDKFGVQLDSSKGYPTL